MTTTVFAYDGSTHGDWVARYAVRLARGRSSPLLVLHVDENATHGARVDVKLQHLRDIAEASGVPFQARHLPLRSRSVARALEAELHDLRGSLLVTGLRVRESGRGLLRGTVSEDFLRSARYDVLAVRVVSPGLLGHARHVLYAVSQNPASAKRCAPFLRALAPEMTRLSLLTVLSPRGGRLARPIRAELQSLDAEGNAHLKRCLADLRGALAPFAFPVDSQSSVSSDWPAEVIRHAGRVKAQLLVVGATERSLPERLIFGNALERVLHDTVCDVAIFRRAEAP